MSSFALDKQLTIKTDLSTLEAEALLAEHVGSIVYHVAPSLLNKHLFIGTVSNGRFNIRRSIPYRTFSLQNIFAPATTGKFHGNLDVTRIEVDIRSSPIALLVFLIFLPVILLSFFTAPVYVRIILLLILAVIIASISAEVRRAQILLEAIFSS